MVSSINFVFAPGFKTRFGVLDFEADNTGELHRVDNGSDLAATENLARSPDSISTSSPEPVEKDAAYLQARSSRSVGFPYGLANQASIFTTAQSAASSVVAAPDWSERPKEGSDGTPCKGFEAQAAEESEDDSEAPPLIVMMVASIRDLEDHEETSEEAVEHARKEAAMAVANMGACTSAPPQHQDPPRYGTPTAADGARRDGDDQCNADGSLDQQ